MDQRTYGNLVSDDRQVRVDYLQAAAFRLWGKLGYAEGPAGHITVSTFPYPCQFTYPVR